MDATAHVPIACADHHPQRLIFIDALRVSAIILVIVHHAAQAYGPTGGFWPVHDHAQSDWFKPFYTANAAFGMGLMFLLAGYFVPPSLDRKGPWRFLLARWMRIGIPLASVVLFVQLPAAYLLAGRPPWPEFIHGLYERGWQPIYLHLWFVAQLLLYSAAYVALHGVVVGLHRDHWPPPGHLAIVGFTLVLALITAVVRIWYPIDKWVPFLWIMPAEPAHLPQYVTFFAAGIVAHRGNWFRDMPTRTGLIWLAIGMIASAGIYLGWAFLPWRDVMATGGLSVSSLIRSSWESLIAVSLSVGLIVAFRELFDRPNRLLAAAAAASFGAYIIHPPIVVVAQMAMQGFALPALVKFVVVSLVGSALAFALAHLSSKVPGLRTILGTAGARGRAPATAVRSPSGKPPGIGGNITAIAADNRSD
jgi:peptidoglycan/LPS O-acetylase OafA/YrhL